WKLKEGNKSDTDKKPPEIPIIEGLNGLEKFISFVKQQESCDFNVEDLKIFRKYLSFIRRKYIESMKQKPITDFFSVYSE
ncbi:19685_t:CDS:1, partial [Dentiscutata erythropus]